MEVWKDIEGYDGLYQVSNHARVRSIDRCIKCSDGKTRRLKGMLLSPGPNSWNRHYLTVNLSKCGKIKPHMVHRLVADAFIPNPDNKPEVNHIDGNKKNNEVSNLEWVTHQENMKHASESGLWRPSEKMISATIARCSKPVVCSNGIVYGSQKEAAESLGINGSHISDVCNGKRRKTHGYSFKFVED